MINQTNANVGLNLHSKYYREFCTQTVPVDFIEIHPENYFHQGIDYEYLQLIAVNYPLSFHGVNLSLGSNDTPDLEYLAKLKHLANIFQPLMISEHLSWCRFGSHFLNDLLPIPYNQESLEILKRNVSITQEYLNQIIFIENPAYYLTYSSSDIAEYEFILKLCNATGAKILLDLNNLYINSINHNFDPYQYIDYFPPSVIGEIHLAGHSKYKNTLIDSHSSPIIDKVWQLFDYFIAAKGNHIPCLIEHERNMPEIDQIIEQCKYAKSRLGLCLT